MTAQHVSGYPISSAPVHLEPGETKTISVSVPQEVENFSASQFVVPSDIGDNVQVESLKADDTDLLSASWRGSFFSEYAQVDGGDEGAGGGPRFRSSNPATAYSARIANVSEEAQDFTVMILGEAVVSA